MTWIPKNIFAPFAKHLHPEAMGTQDTAERCPKKNAGDYGSAPITSQTPNCAGRMQLVKRNALALKANGYRLLGQRKRAYLTEARVHQVTHEILAKGPTT